MIKKLIYIAVALVVCVASASGEALAANDEACGELIQELDDVINNSELYSKAKNERIDSLRKDLDNTVDLEERYQKTLTLEGEYETFVSDSALSFLQKAMSLAETMQNEQYINACSLRLAMVYSTSGLFVVADSIFSKFDYNTLDSSLGGLYCYARIRYCENIIRDIDDARFSKKYDAEIDWCRDELIKMWGAGSEMSRKEMANKYKNQGRYKESLEILEDLFKSETVGTHGYAMLAMSVAQCYELMGRTDLQKQYLLIAAITDIKQAIKENEALLALSSLLYNEGDVDRAYRYIKFCLDDANFYNSHFKDSVIARTYSIVDSTYTAKLESHRQKLQNYLIVISIIVVLLIVAVFESYRQRHKLMRARGELKNVNEDLMSMNYRLDEANLVKERYVGYFMNQCSVYVNKLDDFRKNVNRKIKAGQIDDLYVMSSRPLEKEMEELYKNFDRAFLNLYPDFPEKFNALLKPEARIETEKGRLNITLRIYALMRMGITNMGQIAKFLNYSLQTVYNYKSKVKKDSLLDGDEFEEEVKRIGKMSNK